MHTLSDYLLKSDDELRLERNQLATARNHTISLYNTLPPSLVALGFALFVVAALCQLYLKTPGVVFAATTILLFVLFSTALYLNRKLDDKEEIQKEQLRLLQPLSETPHCVDMLNHIERSARARAIYDAAIAMGRQLYVFDFEAAREAVDRDLDDQAAQRRILRERENVEACRKLHGISA